MLAVDHQQTPFGGSDLQQQRSLQQRLTLYEDWNMRLQLQLQQLLRLPQTDLTKFAAKMQNPDIAVPLLQCYDAALMEKQEELDAQRAEVSRLKAALSAAQHGRDDALQSTHLAEELARVTSEKLREDHERFQQRIENAEAELLQVRQRAQQLTESESALKSQLQAEKQRMSQLVSEHEKMRLDYAALEESHAAAQRKLKAAKASDDTESHTSETQKIQLQLLSKENDDKLMEIERLRAKMMQALRQQQDNHTAHLKIVEDKHRTVVEGLREECRSAELQLLKLRAQFARLEVASPTASSIGGGQLTTTNVRTVADIIDSQSRQAQELEIKRLYTELSAAQLQRDDAVYKYEQILSSRQADADDRLADVRRDLDAQRHRAREFEDRYERSEAELTAARDQLRQLKERTKALQSDVQMITAERDSAVRRAEESKKAQQRCEALLQQAREEKEEAIANEKRVLNAQDRRRTEQQQDDVNLRESLKNTIDETQRKSDALQAQLNEAHFAKQHLLLQAQERERQLANYASKIEKLTIGINACKEQLMHCDERLVGYAALEVQWKKDGRQLALQVEQLRMELMRTVRDRDRLAHELQARKF